jgi:hypothetical protein
MLTMEGMIAAASVAELVTGQAPVNRLDLIKRGE